MTAGLGAKRSEQIAKCEPLLAKLLARGRQSEFDSSSRQRDEGQSGQLFRFDRCEPFQIQRAARGIAGEAVEFAKNFGVGMGLQYWLPPLIDTWPSVSPRRVVHDLEGEASHQVSGHHHHFL